MLLAMFGSLARLSGMANRILAPDKAQAEETNADPTIIGPGRPLTTSSRWVSPRFPMRFCADTFFANVTGHRAIVLETVAAVPGMVGAMLTTSTLAAPGWHEMAAGSASCWKKRKTSACI